VARLGVAALVAVALAQASAAPDAAPGAGTPAGVAWLERGRRVYNARCYFCHGYAGDARTVASTFLDPPPRNFSALDPADLARSTMLAAVRDGRAGTAMQGFAGLLDAADMQAVVDFVREEFMRQKAIPARYHSPVNGWSAAPRTSPAAAFVSGALSPDAPWESLSQEQRLGQRLFAAACVVCHARGEGIAAGSPWQPEALSNDHAFNPEAAGAHEDDYSEPPFGLHDLAPALGAASATVRRGEALYQANCAFCHAADGSGRNWIGAFLVPAPADFTRAAARLPASAAVLHGIVRRGIPGTSMPAWESVLSDAEVRAVVAYLAAVFPAFGGNPEPPP
jgi:cytochrome c oxidase cbb3-type subunit 3